MSRICLTPEEAFEAGFSEPCEHNMQAPEGCPQCRLTSTEIHRLVVLLQGALVRPAQGSAAA